MEKHPDYPLTGIWTLEGEATASDRDRVSRAARHQAAQARILVEAHVVATQRPGEFISYSRRTSWYSDHSVGRYRAPEFTFATVPEAVDVACRAGLLDHDKAYPGRLGRQSRFRATANLRDAFEGRRIVCDPRELIVLRDQSKRLLGYADTPETNRMRDRLRQINAAIKNSDIRLSGLPVREGELLPVLDGGIAKATLCRIFNRGSFELGGRFYGGWWINVPSDVRPQIQIEGEPVVELDYSQFHATLLYAAGGRDLEYDAYELAGWPREVSKAAFQTMVNAETPLQTLRAVAQQIGGADAFPQARKLIEGIEERNAQIAASFGSGAGLRLQRVDSDLAETVMLEMMEQGFVVLPVHDSFIVKASGASVLEECRMRNLEITKRKLGLATPHTGWSPRIVPQYGDQVLPVSRLSIRTVSGDHANANSPRKQAPVLNIPRTVFVENDKHKRAA